MIKLYKLTLFKKYYENEDFRKRHLEYMKKKYHVHVVDSKLQDLICQLIKYQIEDKMIQREKELKKRIKELKKELKIHDKI